VTWREEFRATQYRRSVFGHCAVLPNPCRLDDEAYAIIAHCRNRGRLPGSGALETFGEDCSGARLWRHPGDVELFNAITADHAARYAANARRSRQALSNAAIVEIGARNARSDAEAERRFTARRERQAKDDAALKAERLRAELAGGEIKYFSQVRQALSCDPNMLRQVLAELVAEGRIKIISNPEKTHAA